jgi:hypothetical protein
VPVRLPRRSIPWVYLAVGGFYLALRIWSFAGIAGHGSSFVDTVEYERVAHRSLFDSQFWLGFKPWGTPLLWKLLPGPTATAAPVAQWLISVAAWLTLAAVVSRALRSRPVAIAAFAIVLAFSLVPALAVWDGALLSESLTFSLGALFLAALFVLSERPTPKSAGAAVALAFLLAMTRTSNALVVPLFLIPVAVLVLRRRRDVAISLVVASIAIVGIAYVHSDAHEWELPLAEVIALRVLHEPQARAYFDARGMPDTPGLADRIMTNRVPFPGFETAPELASFIPWFNRSARTTYRDFLLSHPDALIVDPIRYLPSLVTPSTSTDDLQALPLQVYEARGYRNALPSPVRRVLYFSSAALVFVCAALVLAALLALGFTSGPRRAWIVPVLGIVTCVPHGMIIFLGGATSLGRHGLFMAILLRLSVFLAALFAVDSFVASRATRSARPASG